jgi:glycosyltransferase involved in cell wall biosynthesis
LGEVFNRVVFIDQENSGVSATLNKGIKKAKGEFVFLTASDDIPEKNTIELFVNFLKDKPKYGLAVGDNRIIDQNGKTVYWDSKKNLVYDKKDAKFETFKEFQSRNRKDKFDFNSSQFGSYQSFLRGNYLPVCQMIKKSYIEKVGMYREDIPLEDWYINLQLAKICKFKFFDQITASYRVHENNSIKDQSKMLPALKEIIYSEKNYCKENGTFDIWQEASKEVNKQIKKSFRKWLFTLNIRKHKIVLRIFGKYLINKNF